MFLRILRKVLYMCHKNVCPSQSKCVTYYMTWWLFLFIMFFCLCLYHVYSLIISIYNLLYYLALYPLFECCLWMTSLHTDISLPSNSLHPTGDIEMLSSHTSVRNKSSCLNNHWFHGSIYTINSLDFLN